LYAWIDGGKPKKMKQKRSLFLGWLLLILLAGCGGGMGENTTTRPTGQLPEVRPALETAETTIEAAAATAEAIQSDPSGATPTIPKAIRPLLTAPVVEPPRIARDVTPDPDEALAVALDPVQAGLPVMPGAMDEQGGIQHTFKVKATLPEVESWYQEKMIALGWKLAERQVTQAASPAGAGLRLIFTRDKLRAVVLLTNVAGEQAIFVSLSLGSS
jgi:hypothetical protein